MGRCDGLRVSLFLLMFSCLFAARSKQPTTRSWKRELGRSVAEVGKQVQKGKGKKISRKKEVIKEEESDGDSRASSSSSDDSSSTSEESEEEEGPLRKDSS